VTSTSPAADSVVATPPTTFTVHVNRPVDPASLAPSDFTVNGIAATSLSYTPGATTISFVFASSPVTAAGPQTMHIDGGAFTRSSDGSPVSQFDGTFGYSLTSTNTFFNSTAAAINDTPPNSVTRSTLNVSIPGGNAIVDVDVEVNITHANVGDLRVVLKSPQGVAVTLASNNGGTGDNFTWTIFDDSASQAIDQGTAPFIGRFRVPSTVTANLSAFNGANPNGTWTLEVRDTVKNKITGTLTNWKLIITTRASTSGATAAGTSVQQSLTLAEVQPQFAAGRTSGSQNAAAVFALAAGNTNPQGIADPPPPEMLLASSPPPALAWGGSASLTPGDPEQSDRPDLVPAVSQGISLPSGYGAAGTTIPVPLPGSASFVPGEPGQDDRPDVFTLPSLGIGQPFGYDPTEGGNGEGTRTAAPRPMPTGEARADDLARLDQVFASGPFASEQAP
jgi:subtilisin-like proprotein convertase family protein